ncbi:hypothetical protein T07_2270 [Trichinella nelsoni]|uniref:Uncharacterized protein n=1 Tax=Trichinella nelsoni TaxID=6336 RepID=A0A0V0SGZ7_9BILA|nr:hypothetical protein T07_2270 [Trichinella nelsoni]
MFTDDNGVLKLLSFWSVRSVLLRKSVRRKIRKECQRLDSRKPSKKVSKIRPAIFNITGDQRERRRLISLRQANALCATANTILNMELYSND